MLVSGRAVGTPGRSSRRHTNNCRSSSSPNQARWSFPASKGGPLRRSNFNTTSAWPYAVRSVGAAGQHVHDLRHTGNTFAASGGDLMA